MLRFTIRLIGYGLIAISFATLIVDGTASLGFGALRFTDLAQIAKSIAPKAFADLQNSMHFSFIESGMSFILSLPVTIVFVFIGLTLVIVARRPKAHIGFEPMQ
jgi:hypothetical protein